jgi:hypothetical protein
MLQTAALDDATQLHGGNTALYELPFGLPDIEQSRKFANKSGDALDAIQVLKFMKFSTHLKNVGKGNLALKDAVEVACESDKMLQLANDQMPENPGSTALYIYMLHVFVWTLFK